ncbi:hypothetical protein [uncultured Campylobacter sp.]|nr:hypothetical protein [uncultured Campylobacter sp.]
MKRKLCRDKFNRRAGKLAQIYKFAKFKMQAVTHESSLKLKI